MYRIKERNTNEIVINKSRFIGISIPLSDEKEVKSIIKDLMKEYPKATHYCYAYRINGKEKSCDDGEPSGTAGRPMLEYLIKNELENVLVVAIRYFGGIKLGAGGLLRAYVDSAKIAFDGAVLYKIEEHTEYEIIVEYSLFDYVHNYLLEQDGKVEDIKFEEEITISYLALTLNLEDLKQITNGNIKTITKSKKEVYIKK